MQINKKIIEVIFLATFFVLPAFANAAPSVSGVSGVFVDGQSVTLSGSAFGTKASGNAAPLRWETWGDSVGLNAAEASGNYWSVEARTSQNPYVSNDVQRVPGRLVLDSSMRDSGTFYGTNSKTFFKNNIGFSSTHKTYLNYWIYTDKGFTDSSRGGMSQTKHYKIVPELFNDGDTAGLGVPEFSMSIWEWTNPDDSMWLNSIYEWPSATAAAQGFRNDLGSSHNLNKGIGWYNVQAMYDWGTVDGNNSGSTLYATGPNYTKYGKWKASGGSFVVSPPEFYPGINCKAPGSVMYNGQRYQFTQGTVGLTCNTPPDQDSTHFRLAVTDPMPNALEFWEWTMKSGYNWQSNGFAYKTDARVDYGGKAYKCIADVSSTTTPDVDTQHWVKVYDTLWPAPDVKMYFDSIYVDNSFARIEIGDQPTYDSCTHREIQLASSWSDSQIEFNVNKGTLPDGQAYLFVIDESGTASSGYPISFGVQTDFIAPSAPSGLNVL